MRHTLFESTQVVPVTSKVGSVYFESLTISLRRWIERNSILGINRGWSLRQPYFNVFNHNYIAKHKGITDVPIVFA